MPKNSKDIIKVLVENIHNHLDGKTCILEMKKEAEKNNSRGSWKQMEWAGWYLEEKARTTLINHLGGNVGPSITTSGPQSGCVVFDYENNDVWDIKTHTIDGHKEACIFNDREAVEIVLNRYGKIGFIIFMCDMELESEKGEFRIWHDNLKNSCGGPSDYVISNLKRNASHRKRKAAANIRKILTIEFTSINDLKRGEDEGWLIPFQRGMRNSNGNPRREKISILLSKIPHEYITCEYNY